MNIPFMITWPDKMGEQKGAPTYFPEKILASLVAFHPQFDWEGFADEIDKKEQPYECTSGDYIMKPHTIRHNKSKRYKEGTSLQPFIWSGKAYRSKQFYFSPKVPCTGTQSIEIRHSAEKWRQPWVFVDGNIMTAPEVELLALNDGFDSVRSFFRYFDSDFKGDIIHWTDLRY